jgi:predicted dehydrogenase/threonine dehydrogenase-like Zn-dependent dehydrogenase
VEQLTQNLKSGEMSILEVPYPVLAGGCVLVRNHFSVISAGTEGKTVKDARLGYVGKAMARKDEVKKVIRTARTIGLSETYKIMMNKLDAPSPLGYSCAGEVIAVADDVTEFKVGDRVACAGAGAVHAEVVAVPKNLCAKVPDQVGLEEACFTTLGAIALQGIRQADLRLGENCVVIGLGLIGQLTVQLLQAAGVKAIGIDIDEKMVSLSRSLGAAHAYTRNTEALEQSIAALTQGHGADAVIITAGSGSTDPVDLAGALCRQKGKVVIVGSVPTGFKRSGYYKKELELKMSCSYGPGRYDRAYEESGIDYPYGYVRWTENRNMQAFLDLLGQRRIEVEKIITHRFEFRKAPEAYQLILDKTEPYLGIALKYDAGKPLAHRVDLGKKPSLARGEANVAFIGAGSFASNVLLPALKGQCRFTGLVTGRANQARNIADKYGFAYCSNTADEIFADKDTSAVFIATRHDTHAKYVLQALEHRKHVFVEKPLCLHEEELDLIRDHYAAANVSLMLGFNRRFAPHIQKAQALLREIRAPRAIHYRINAGQVPADHWIHDKNIGGGRILGEVCHFIDLAAYLAGAKIKSVAANSLEDPNGLTDTLNISLAFANGSIAGISYFSNGNKELDKEYLEVFAGGVVLQLNDFKELVVYGKSKKASGLGKQDKGHRQEVAAFIDSIRNGGPAPIPFEEIYDSMRATFKVQESLALQGKQIQL